MRQLKLFVPVEPDWQNITLEWLFEFLNNQYPEVKFYIDKSGDKPYIRQGLHKKIVCDFYIGEFDKSVTWVKNRNYISVGYGKCFDNWEQSNCPIDTMAEFMEYLSQAIEESKKNIILYREHIEKLRKKWHEEEN